MSTTNDPAPGRAQDDMSEVHIYSIDDLFQGDISGKKLIVHSKKAKEYLENHPTYGRAIFATNDPEQKYGEREPFTENVGPSGLTSKRLSELCAATGISDGRFSDRETVRRVVESLIADGTLIRRDELVAWLRDGLHTRFRGFQHVPLDIIDHLNKKP